MRKSHRSIPSVTSRSFECYWHLLHDGKCWNKGRFIVSYAAKLKFFKFIVQWTVA